MVTKTFYCSRCEKQVESTQEDYAINHSTATGKGFFCPLCGDNLNNTPDNDAIYERIRDDKIFEEEQNE